MKNKKGFTLVELLAVIVILAVIILIAVNAVLPQMRKARRNSFIDEAINFAKAAETAYVSDQINGEQHLCYSVKYLQTKYVSKADEKYDGYVKLTIAEDGESITKKIWITDGSNFYAADVDPSSTNNFTNTNLKTYSATEWNNAKSGMAAANCQLASGETVTAPAPSGN